MGAVEASKLGRKLVHVSTGGAASVIATIAEALGCEVLVSPGEEPEQRPDLMILEAPSTGVAMQPANLPMVAVAAHRLRRGEVQRLISAGVSRVFDSQICMLEAAFGITELLFTTGAEQRRYAENFGQIAVRFMDQGGQESRGALVGLTRRGGRVSADTAPGEGTAVTLVAEIGPWEVPIQGRVAYVDTGARPGFGIEFALEQDPFAPRLERFLSESGRPRPALSSASDDLSV